MSLRAKLPRRLLTNIAKPLFFRRPRPGYGFFGCFPTLAAARSFIGKEVPAQFDGNHFVGKYIPMMQMFRPEDYPILFWLSRFITAGTKIFDLGGGVGQSFFAYDPYLSFPADITWHVCDVPALSEAGTLSAQEQGEHRLRFTSDFQHGDGHDILLTNGTLQYLEVDLADILNGYRNRPRHILINRIPVTDKEGFWTVQRGSKGGFNPYRIFTQTSFTSSLAPLGYKLQDSWQQPRPLTIPFYPELAIDKYTGYLFSQQ